MVSGKNCLTDNKEHAGLSNLSEKWDNMSNTNIPMNDLTRQYRVHSQTLEAAALEVMRSGWWLNGPKTKEFCSTFAASLGVNHCIGVGNGTDALELAIRALLNEARDNQQVFLPAPEIITVANAGGYTTTACYLTGCTPVFVDINAGDQLISLPSVVAALSENTLAVVATHLYGGLVDISALRLALNEAGYSYVAIIEDCAQAHGLVDGAIRSGAAGTISTFSFYPTKNLGALGDAGAIVTNSDALAARVRSLHQYGWERKYHIDGASGRNSRMDELQAALLSKLLPFLSENNSRRVAILQAYQDALPRGVEMVCNKRATVAHLAVLLTNDRKQLQHHMNAHGVSTDIHYPVLDCDQKGWQDLPMRIGPLGLDVSRKSVASILTIPCFPTMTSNEIEVVCKALSSYDA